MARREAFHNVFTSELSLGASTTRKLIAVGLQTLGTPIDLLDFATWRIRNAGTPGTATGPVFVELRDFSGVLGVNGIPTTVLATSESVLVETITDVSGGAIVVFPFVGAERINLDPLTDFMLVLNALGVLVSNIASQTGAGGSDLGRAQNLGSWSSQVPAVSFNFELFSSGADIVDPPVSPGGIDVLTEITDLTSIH